ncbi:helix-turn-helix domain-containing protein [Pararhizobium sp. IMCC21322]|uniref:helix-turn-helix domain-containing protein n=1 Tax=Pararhizobium sp. IMCC21322 TaxID=3067903 RepID=UPI002740D6C6|nr:helix-turn-helix domain-containing protein [Pararhizobium sp. IMCC21322]
MTPLGKRLRELRSQKSVTLKHMADELGVSSAYLSALEHGHRGTPGWLMLQRIIAYFNLIWDDAEDLVALARSSDPRVTVDTSGLSPEATRLANLLAANIADLPPEALKRLIEALEAELREAAIKQE